MSIKLDLSNTNDRPFKLSELPMLKPALMHDTEAGRACVIMRVIPYGITFPVAEHFIAFFHHELGAPIMRTPAHIGHVCEFIRFLSKEESVTFSGLA